MNFGKLYQILKNIVDGKIDDLEYFIQGCYMYLEKSRTGDLEVISEGLPNAEKLDLLIRKFAELLANGKITFDFTWKCFEAMEHLKDEKGNCLKDGAGNFVKKEGGMRDAFIKKKDQIIPLIPDTPCEEPEVEINNLFDFLMKLIGPELLSICRMKFMTMKYGNIENIRQKLIEIFRGVSFEDENLELVESCCKPGVESRNAFLRFLCDALQDDFENVCSTFRNIKRLDIEKTLMDNEIQIQSFFDIAG